MNIIEILDDITQLQEGEFLITTAFGIVNNTRLQETLVDQLHARALAGLAIQTGHYLENIPAALLRQADELSFPVVELPKEASFASITKAVLQRLVNRQFELLSYSQKIYRQLTALVLGDADVDELAMVLSGLVNRSVDILDPDGCLLAAASQPDNSQAAVDWTAGFGAESAFLEQVLTSRKPLHVPGEGVRPALEITPVLAGDEVHGYIAIATETSLGEPDLIAAGHTATVLALLLTKKKAVAKAEARMQGDFFDDLLSGSHGPPETLAKRAAYLGLNTGAPHMVMIIDIDNFQSFTARHSETEIQRLKNGLHRTVRETLVRDPPPVLKNESDSIVLFLPSGRSTPKAVAGRIQDRIHQAFPQITISIGIGIVCPSLVELTRSYQEAGQALKIIRLTGRQGAIAYFPDLGLYHLLLELTPNRAALAGFYHATVGPLFQYDRSRHGELFATPQAYLESGFNNQETANKLFVHRHTLRYRLDRIAAITGKDLGRWQGRLELELGLLIAQVYRPENPDQPPTC